MYVISFSLFNIQFSINHHFPDYSQLEIEKTFLKKCEIFFLVNGNV